MIERAGMRILALVAAVLVAGCGADPAQHEVAVPWALGGQWLVADLHTHTRFSDGALTPDELVNTAIANGCDALAITDHSDAGVKGANAEYFEEIRRLRAKHPRLVLFAGMEWNIPPHRGREHVTVLLSTALEGQVLPEFRKRYDPGEGVSAADALKWLQAKVQDPTDAVLIYNHPSREAKSHQQTLADFSLWRDASAVMIGFEGAPGHQKYSPVGAYTAALRSEQRWDPVAAAVGGVWDTLLDRGLNVWAALAGSDYHNDKSDFPPCGFAQTFLQVPERTPAGVLKALHAGTYWASHGRFLGNYLFTVAAPGLEVPASPGEVIRYRRNEQVRVSVAVERAEASDSSALTVEIIGNCRSGKPEILAAMALDSKQSAVDVPIERLAPGADKESCYLRSRVRNKRQDGDDWLAYSNPVRIKLPN